MLPNVRAAAPLLYSAETAAGCRATCAAGTGRFLGAAASALDIDLDHLGPTALRGEKPVKISTTCTVFAGAELRERLSLGEKREDILAGLHRAIVLRDPLPELEAARQADFEKRAQFEDLLTLIGQVPFFFGSPFYAAFKRVVIEIAKNRSSASPRPIVSTAAALKT